MRVAREGIESFFEKMLFFSSAAAFVLFRYKLLELRIGWKKTRISLKAILFQSILNSRDFFSLHKRALEFILRKFLTLKTKCEDDDNGDMLLKRKFPTTFFLFIWLASFQNRIRCVRNDKNLNSIFDCAWGGSRKN